MSFAVKDASLIQTAALPNGAVSTTLTGFDLGSVIANGDRLLADMELVVDVPATTTGELGDTQTLTFHIEHALDSAFSSNLLTEHSTLLVVTGAGGAGAVAAQARCRLPTNCQRFVRVKCTKTGATNASTKSMTGSLVF